MHNIWRNAGCLLAALSIWTQAQAELTHYERLVVASCLVLEAASEGTEGMQAVLNVIHNRAGGDPDLVVGVVCKPKQFTSLNNYTGTRTPDYGPLIERATQDPLFSDAYALVQLMEKGQLEDLTAGSDHYHAGEPPYWTLNMTPTKTIGMHRFYRSTPIVARIE